MRYDVVVLGAGVGGHAAAIRAAQFGLSVAIIEARYWGGVSSNIGRTPSRVLLRSAEIAHLLGTGDRLRGIAGAAPVPFDTAFERSRKAAMEHSHRLRSLLRENSIDQYEGHGIFVDQHTIRVKSEDIDSLLTFDAAIIDTGATRACCHVLAAEAEYATAKTASCPGSYRLLSPSSERDRSAWSLRIRWRTTVSQ